jgi:hypothetical protein
MAWDDEPVGAGLAIVHWADVLWLRIVGTCLKNGQPPA